MRRQFKIKLYKQMELNKDIWVLVGDLGYGMFDDIRKDFPNRFVNCGASEHSMLAIACGLALEGKIVFVYSITSFLLYRGFEVLRTYIDHENIPVKLIGSGRYRDYEHDGFSHDASDDKRFLRNFKNVICYWPETNEELEDLLTQTIKNNRPTYINLRR